jgi:hypothetical protein
MTEFQTISIASSSSPYGWGFSLDKKKSSEEMQHGLVSWVEGAVHRCLVCLGDLARYQLELGLALAAQPARYYQRAVRLRPEGGVPFNQLAMLCVEENYGLDQLYYCVTSNGCFEGGEANLKRLDHPGQLSGAWLALTVSVVVMLLNKISKGDKANNVSVGLCQARLLALLSHLALRVVGTVGREVWGEELELPPIDLVEETEIIYKYLFWRLKRPGRLSRGRKGRTSWRSC